MENPQMEQTIWAIIDYEGYLNCTSTTKERADKIVEEGDNEGDFRAVEMQLYGEPPCWTALKQQVEKNLATLYEDRDEFIEDTDPNEPFRSKEYGLEKGCLIQLVPKKRMDEIQNGDYEYGYKKYRVHLKAIKKEIKSVSEDGQQIIFENINGVISFLVDKDFETINIIF